MNTQPDDFGRKPPVQEINPFQKFPLGGLGFGTPVDKDLRADVEKVPEQIALTDNDAILVPEEGDEVEELLPTDAQLPLDPFAPTTSLEADAPADSGK